MLKLYKNTFYCLSGLLAALLISSPAYASDSVVRVKCDENDSTTKIYLNNQYKGNCPVVTAFVNAGRLEVRAQKSLDAEHEQVFIKQLTIIKGSAERVTVELGDVQLTAAAAKARRLAIANAEREALNTDLTAARAGELAAMEKMVQRYTIGDGVTASSSKANFWQQKIESSYAQTDLIAAREGKVSAMSAMAERYRMGKGVAKSSKKAQFWDDKIAAFNAQEDLTAANAGNITAMKRLANRYATGDGLKKDSRLAQTWLDKADVATIEAANLEQAERAQAAREVESRKIQKEIDDISYTTFVDVGVEMIEEEENPFAITLGGPVISVVSTAFDLVATPISLSRRAYLSQQLAAHPSAWAKPDSMIAKAYRQQQAVVSETEAPILAAR